MINFFCITFYLLHCLPVSPLCISLITDVIIVKHSADVILSASLHLRYEHNTVEILQVLPLYTDL